MNTLDDFAARIRNEVFTAERPAGPADAMGRLKDRMNLFRTVAGRILAEIVEPRIRIVESLFPNAVRPRKTEPLHCTLLLGYCERFPASVKLDFACGQDEEFSSLQLTQQLFIAPSFTRYDQFDRTEQPLDHVDDEAVAKWVEDRLSAALRAYLYIEATDRRQEEALATDPVCHMRVIKVDAAGHLDYRGHRFYFCAPSCRDEFAADPERFAQMETDP